MFLSGFDFLFKVSLTKPSNIYQNLLIKGILPEKYQEETASKFSVTELSTTYYLKVPDSKTESQDEAITKYGFGIPSLNYIDKSKQSQFQLVLSAAECMASIIDCVWFRIRKSFNFYEKFCFQNDQRGIQRYVTSIK